MCKFISWIEHKGVPYYLSSRELKTRDGKILLLQVGRSPFDEIIGHGAIRLYFGLSFSQGENYETSDFSDPKQFPSEIVKDLKAGLFKEMGIAEGMLSKKALIKFRQKKQEQQRHFDTADIAHRKKCRQLVLQSINEFAADLDVSILARSDPKRSFIIKSNDDSRFNNFRSQVWGAEDVYFQEHRELRRAFEQNLRKIFWDMALEPKNRKKQWQ